MQQTLPERLTLVEDGEWAMPYTGMTTMNVNHDDMEWTSYGWKAVTYDGHIHFRHKEKSIVEQWLVDHNFYDTGDGAHYQQHAFPLDEVPDTLLFNFKQFD